MPDDIVLIGPVRAGKSTQGRLLAARLGLPQVSLDELRWAYYAEIGFDPAHAAELRRQEGFAAMMYYRQLFAAHAVERLLAGHTRCVIDFGADIFESSEMLARVRAALAPYPHVVLLLPSPDLAESRRILAERDPSPPADLHFDILTRMLTHPTYTDLAKIKVYTAGRTPEQTCEEILQRVHLS